MDKKGQLTLYIILGIILLFGVLLLSYYMNIYAGDDETRPVVIDVPVQVHPINNFVTECVKKTATDAFTVIGYHGGFMEAKDLYVNEFDPTESDGLAFGSNRIPYWWHMTSNNRCQGTCDFRSQRLPIDGPGSVEEEIETYIENHLKSCLRNYEDFKVQGFDVLKEGDISASVDILDFETQVLVDFPMKIKLHDDEYDIDQFYTIIEFDFKKIYQVATDITNLELDFSFFERQTMNLISAFSMGIQEDRLPPISEQSFEPGKFRYWFKSETEDRLKEILMTYVPVFNVYGSKNSNMFNSDDKIKQGIYRSFVVPSNTSLDLSNMEVNFIYLDSWPIYFDISGRGISGEFIGPENAFFSFFSWLGMQRYAYYYDISYPVLVEIFDPEAFGGKGYRFFFALEANVRGNHEMNSTYESIKDVPPMVGSMLCEHNQKVSNITLKVTDPVLDAGVDEVQVLYSCGQESCYIGVTEINSSDPTYSYMRGGLPMCIGGHLNLNKFEYLSQDISLTSLSDEHELTVALEPYRYINVTVMKKNLVDSGTWTLRDTPVYLLDNEYAIIQMTSDDFSTYGIYYGNTTQTTMRLVPGEYEIEIDLVFGLPTPYGQNSITIPEDKRCEGGSLLTDCEEVIMPKIVFNDTFIEGGISIQKNDSDLWVLDGSDLDSANQIILYAIAIPGEGVVTDALTHDDMEVFGTKHKYSKEYRQEIEPEFK